jgi:hypothetical protein
MLSEDGRPLPAISPEAVDAREVMPLLGLSRRHTVRVLAKLSFLRKEGNKHGARRELQRPVQASELDSVSPIVTTTPENNSTVQVNSIQIFTSYAPYIGIYIFFGGSFHPDQQEGCTHPSCFTF